MILLLTSLAILSTCMAQSLTCPTGVADPNTFYVIGASGGDSKSECENTAAATTAGLAAGMNAVELDLSVSQDNVVFLWNDPIPLDPASQARSNGLFVTGMCRPTFKTFVEARNMVFSTIRKVWVYTNSTGVDQAATIPTLHEWMDAFAANAALDLIILDLKVAEVGLADYLVSHVMDKADTLGVAAKIKFVSSSFSMAGALQSSLARTSRSINLVSRVWGGTTATVHVGYDSALGLDAISQATTECYGHASLGQSVSSNAWREYQTIISNHVTSRDAVVTAGGNYIPVISWRVNKLEKMAWLMCIGVDGIYTDEIATLADLNTRKNAGTTTCCTEDKELPCMNPLDPRVTGQGCSGSFGLSYADLETTACGLLGFPLDFLLRGTKITCRQSSFCKV